MTPDQLASDAAYYVPLVVAAAAASAAVLPQGKPGTWWYIIRTSIIDIAALNIWNAKNHPQ